MAAAYVANLKVAYLAAKGELQRDLEVRSRALLALSDKRSRTFTTTVLHSWKRVVEAQKVQVVSTSSADAGGYPKSPLFALIGGYPDKHSMRQSCLPEYGAPLWPRHADRFAGIDAAQASAEA